MKFSILFLFILFFQGALTISNTQAATLQIYVITPPRPLNWKSPSTLLASTLENAYDYAPNSHFIVHLILDHPNVYGVQEVLTGMSRANKMGTLVSSARAELGLAAMFQQFQGELDQAIQDQKELQKARSQKRLMSLMIPVDSEKADRMMAFLDDWIRYGSFRHYAGGADVDGGVASGCADFAMHFMKVATEGALPLKEWLHTVYLPDSLMKGTSEKTKNGVSIEKILNSKIPWGVSEKDGPRFTTLDADLMASWMRSHGLYESGYYYQFQNFYELSSLSNEVNFNQEDLGVKAIGSFKIRYPEEKEETVRDIWSKISVKVHQ